VKRERLGKRQLSGKCFCKDCAISPHGPEKKYQIKKRIIVFCFEKEEDKCEIGQKGGR
jgi:hypothetical protein